MRRMTPPLPAASRPSKTTTTFRPWALMYSCKSTSSRWRRASSLSNTASGSFAGAAGPSPFADAFAARLDFAVLSPMDPPPWWETKLSRHHPRRATSARPWRRPQGTPRGPNNGIRRNRAGARPGPPATAPPPARPSGRGALALGGRELGGVPHRRILTGDSPGSGYDRPDGGHLGPQLSRGLRGRLRVVRLAVRARPGARLPHVHLRRVLRRARLAHQGRDGSHRRVRPGLLADVHGLRGERRAGGLLAHAEPGRAQPGRRDAC